MIKYQRLLYDAGRKKSTDKISRPSIDCFSGLTPSTSRQRRRSADDSIVGSFNDLISINDDLMKMTNLDQLKEIIRNQRKYNQQLQTCIRLNKSESIESSTMDKFQEQIQVKTFLSRWIIPRIVSLINRI